MKIQLNSVRVKIFSWQFFVLPSAGFESKPLVHYSTNLLSTMANHLKLKVSVTVVTSLKL